MEEGANQWHTSFCNQDAVVTTQHEIILPATLIACNAVLLQAQNTLQQLSPGSKVPVWMICLEQLADSRWQRIHAPGASAPHGLQPVPGFLMEAPDSMQDVRFPSRGLRLTGAMGDTPSSLQIPGLQRRSLLAVKAMQGVDALRGHEFVRLELYLSCAREVAAQPAGQHQLHQLLLQMPPQPQQQQQQQRQQQQPQQLVLVSAPQPLAQQQQLLLTPQQYLQQHQQQPPQQPLAQVGLPAGPLSFGTAAAAAAGAFAGYNPPQPHQVPGALGPAILLPEGSPGELQAKLDVERTMRRAAEECTAAVVQESTAARASLEAELAQVKAEAAAAAEERAALLQQLQAARSAAEQAAADRAACEKQLAQARGAAERAAAEQATLEKQLAQARAAAEQAAAEQAQCEKELVKMRVAVDRAASEQALCEKELVKMHIAAEQAAADKAALEKELGLARAAAEQAAADKAALEKEVGLVRAAAEQATAGKAACENQLGQLRAALSAAARAAAAGEGATVEQQVQELRTAAHALHSRGAGQLGSLLEQLAAAKAAAKAAEDARSSALHIAARERASLDKEVCGLQHQLKESTEALGGVALEGAEARAQCEQEREAARAARAEASALKQQLQELQAQLEEAWLAGAAAANTAHAAAAAAAAAAMKQERGAGGMQQGGLQAQQGQASAGACAVPCPHQAPAGLVQPATACKPASPQTPPNTDPGSVTAAGPSPPGQQRASPTPGHGPGCAAAPDQPRLQGHTPGHPQQQASPAMAGQAGMHMRPVVTSGFQGNMPGAKRKGPEVQGQGQGQGQWGGQALQAGPAVQPSATATATATATASLPPDQQGPSQRRRCEGVAHWQGEGVGMGIGPGDAAAGGMGEEPSTGTVPLPASAVETWEAAHIMLQLRQEAAAEACAAVRAEASLAGHGGGVLPPVAMRAHPEGHGAQLGPPPPAASLGMGEGGVLLPAPPPLPPGMVPVELPVPQAVSSRQHPPEPPQHWQLRRQQAKGPRRKNAGEQLGAVPEQRPAAPPGPVGRRRGFGGAGHCHNMRDLNDLHKNSAPAPALAPQAPVAGPMLQAAPSQLQLQPQAQQQLGPQPPAAASFPARGPGPVAEPQDLQGPLPTFPAGTAAACDAGAHTALHSQQGGPEGQQPAPPQQQPLLPAYRQQYPGEPPPLPAYGQPLPREQPPLPLPQAAPQLLQVQATSAAAPPAAAAAAAAPPAAPAPSLAPVQAAPGPPPPSPAGGVNPLGPVPQHIADLPKEQLAQRLRDMLARDVRTCDMSPEEQRQLVDDMCAQLRSCISGASAGGGGTRPPLAPVQPPGPSPAPAPAPAELAMPPPAGVKVPAPVPALGQAHSLVHGATLPWTMQGQGLTPVMVSTGKGALSFIYPHPPTAAATAAAAADQPGAPGSMLPGGQEVCAGL